ncbi:MAG TPA: Smr/MutS family protein [Rhodospirillales bacterium]|nr:Smr/MutS family protein [Rhodospirillales bacterium]
MTAGDGDGESDRALWDKVRREIRPLKRREPPPPPVSAQPKTPPPAADGSGSRSQRRERTLLSPPPVRVALAPPADLLPGVAGGVDKRTLAKLRRGQIAPESRIDLHNMTQSEAYAALGSFLAAAQAAGKRCVLVITGKGYRSDGAVGVLRTNVPHWLNQPDNRARILAFAYAAAADGGEGALYVLLRRRRP